MHNERQDASATPANAEDLRRANAAPIISLSVDEASAATGISRTKLYELIKSERLTARKAGGRTLIETAELYRLLRALPTIGRQPEPAVAA